MITNKVTKVRFGTNFEKYKNVQVRAKIYRGDLSNSLYCNEQAIKYLNYLISVRKNLLT